MEFERSRELLARFRALIPGRGHTYAKGDDQYPETMPVFIERGAGAQVWDVDGNRFIEFGSGLRSVTLGHAFEPVVEAVRQQLPRGNNFVRPSSLELECAECVQQMIPGAEMVKFGKHGSDATNAAVKLARASTGRELVVICGDHPFFSVDDWFIATTPMNAGIPESTGALTRKFHYNDLESLRRLFAEHPGRVAAVMLEPERIDPPQPGFLHELKDICRHEGAVLIFDENITGFRWHNGGGGAFHGVEPDLAAFGKGIANGFALSALTGRRELMRLGGWDHDRPRVFLLSTTHGAEGVALAAALASMRYYQTHPVVETLWKQGSRLAKGVMRAASELGVQDHFFVLGRPCCLLYATRDEKGAPSQPFRTLFLQETMRRGILAPSFVVNYSHGDAEIDATVEAVRGALEVYGDALRHGVERYLEGRPVKPVFRRTG
jgi:glutamate-1-semialdehyde 2,1-aminomutase